MPVRRLLRSKKRTTISPRELPGPELEEVGDVSWETRSAVCESIAVEISGGSRMDGRGMGKDCAEREDVWEDEAVGE